MVVSSGPTSFPLASTIWGTALPPGEALADGLGVAISVGAGDGADSRLTIPICCSVFLHPWNTPFLLRASRIAPVPRSQTFFGNAKKPPFSQIQPPTCRVGASSNPRRFGVIIAGMCGRFTLRTPPRDMVEIFELLREPEASPRYTSPDPRPRLPRSSGPLSVEPTSYSISSAVTARRCRGISVFGALKTDAFPCGLTAPRLRRS